LATKTTDEQDTRRFIIKEIAETPALREEAQRTLAVVESMASPPRNPNDVWVAMQKLTLVRRMPDFGNEPAASKALRSAWLKLYYDILKDYPLLAIHRGVDSFLKSNSAGYFPQPAEIRKFAEPHCAEILTAIYRLREALKIESPTDHRSPEEREKVIAMMKADGIMDEEGNIDFSSWFKRKGAPKPQGPTMSKEAMAARVREYADRGVVAPEGEGEDYA
jgi:hypothetical protein